MLALFDLRIGQRPAADGQVEILVADGLGELGVLLDRRRQVGVGHQHPAALGGFHALADGVTLPVVHGEVHDSAGVGVVKELIGDQSGAIGRSVVDDQDLRSDLVRGQVGVNPLECRLEPLLLVVSGDDDGQVRPDDPVLRHDSLRIS